MNTVSEGASHFLLSEKKLKLSKRAFQTASLTLTQQLPVGKNTKQKPKHACAAMGC